MKMTLTFSGRCADAPPPAAGCEGPPDTGPRRLSEPAIRASDLLLAARTVLGRGRVRILNVRRGVRRDQEEVRGVASMRANTRLGKISESERLQCLGLCTDCVPAN